MMYLWLIPIGLLIVGLILLLYRSATKEKISSNEINRAKIARHERNPEDPR